MGGSAPRLKEIRIFADEMGLKTQQIYKWFWDMNQKCHHDSELAMRVVNGPTHLGQDGRVASVSLDEIKIEGRDGSGKKLTKKEVRSALKLNKDAERYDDDLHKIQDELEMNIERSAQKLIAMPSPAGTRQIV